MLGSIIGDIVGSIYEFGNIKTKEFELFAPHGTYTDDSILTVATADWILNGGSPATYYADWGNAFPFPRGGYGGGFVRWLRVSANTIAGPYNSHGNGSAMRVGPVGWAYDTKEEVLAKAKESAECTHNHPEGIKGAQAVALCIFMCRQKWPKERIREEIEKEFGYHLDFTCDEIRDSYCWEGSCQESVPQAIVAFLDGTDFEDCIRNAISIGGDSDTIGCITGSIAEAFYGIPTEIRNQAISYIPESFLHVIKAFEHRYGSPSDAENAPQKGESFKWEELRQFCASRWPEHLGRTHGVEHWDRVAKFGRLLYQEGADMDVVMAFAYLHDSERIDNDEDVHHGKRASVLIDSIRHSQLRGLSDEQIGKLKRACELHTTEHRTGDMTIDICFDADRMDLLRVGILPLSERMATKRGTELVADPHYVDAYDSDLYFHIQ